MGMDMRKIDSGCNQSGTKCRHIGSEQMTLDVICLPEYGRRDVSLFLIGITGALVASLIGSIYGGIARYFGGIVDDIMMRIVEVLFKYSISFDCYP